MTDKIKKNDKINTILLSTVVQELKNKKPFYIVGPFNYGPLYIPRTNLLIYFITLVIYTILLPYITYYRKQFGLPKSFLYFLYILYTAILLYFFGVATAGYIAYENVENLFKTIYKKYGSKAESNFNPIYK